MARDNYKERKENRIEYHESQSEKMDQKSTDSYKEARKLMSVIPPGQPILIGHHSERTHRNHIKKVDRAMDKSVEFDSKSRYHQQKADAIKSNRAISSDDPDAIVKVKKQLESCIANHELMKTANKFIKSKTLSDVEKIDKLVELGIKEENAHIIMNPDFMNRVGFPSYVISNSNANISRLKKRLKELEHSFNRVQQEYEVKGVKVIENVEANRLQLIFDFKPEEDLRKQLKSCGFRWSPRFGAWQRHLNEAANYAMGRFFKEYAP